jgi:plastocyanin
MKSRILISLPLILLLAACAASPTPAANPPAANNPSATQNSSSSTGTDINISGFAFSPVDLTVAAGTTVTWTNMDDVMHTVVADDGSWKSENMNVGEKFSHTFSTAGVFTYHCGVHPSMTGTITVVP